MRAAIEGAIDQMTKIHPDCQGKEVDGIVYCEKCGAPKQTMLQMLGKPRKVWIMCSCMSDKQANEEQKFRMKLEKEQIERMRTIGIPEKEYQNNTFANADPDIQPENMQLCRQIVNKFDEVYAKGTVMLFCGPTGTGKSYAANSVANALIDRKVPVLTTSFSHICLEIQAASFEDKAAYYRDILKYPLVVIDDLGAERDTQYTEEVIYRVINDRVTAGKPMIITTNHGVEFFKDPPSDAWQRICSRLLMRCYPVKFVGEDNRKKEFVKNFKIAKDVLFSP